MKEILFTEILFNKTIRGEKTMTRSAPTSLKAINEDPDDWNPYQVSGNSIEYESGYTEKHGVYSCFDAIRFINNDNVSEWIKPTYEVGEIVCIKELVAEYHYKVFRDRLKFQNKMFVGNNNARYYIRITDVKCERLYNISDEDCLKEGIEIAYTSEASYGIKINDHMYKDYMDKTGINVLTARKSFFSLFRFSNKIPKSKEIPNPWVFCYEYVLHNKDGNEL